MVVPTPAADPDTGRKNTPATSGQPGKPGRGPGPPGAIGTPGPSAGREPVIYVHYALMKARQEELLRTAARDRRAAEARRSRRLRTMPAPPRRLPGLRLHRLFS